MKIERCCVPSLLAGTALIAACATSPQPQAPRALIDDSAVRSVFYPLPSAACRTAPCAGPVPPEHVVAFKRELAAAGFEVVEARGRAAPVVRINVDHVATTPTECNMNGVVYVADNAIEVKRTFIWQHGAHATTFGAAGERIFSPELRDHILRTCLGAFAKAARQSLLTGASPVTPTASR
jgi:hypothetical protein